MLRRISHLLAALAFLLTLTGLTSAQPPSPVECPAIVVEAPLHALAPDEEARFTVQIAPKKPEWKFRYTWTLSHGQLLSGQGTESITVRRPLGSVVDATVHIAGGPDDSMCPVVSTDRATWATDSSQPSECPTIQVRGPDGIPIPGQLVRYTATVALNRSVYDPKYNWSISAGEIVSGQGTEKIVLRPPGSSLTVTVDLLDLPDGCKASASESNSGPEPPPPAVKIVQFRGTVTPDLDQIRLFAAELKNNPNNQGYILVGHTAGTTQAQMYSREQSIRDAVRNADPANFDDSRITITAVERSADVVEFWRVPPGASNPICGACEVPKVCPTVTVSGPLGITEPGSIAEYSADIKGHMTEGLSYLWTVVGGELISGQGTLTPKIKPEGFWASRVTATLEVIGFPKGCPNTDSETYAVACMCQPILFDEFSIAPSRIDKRRLDALVESLGKYPDSKLHIIEYFRPRTSVATVRRKLEVIRVYLTKMRGLDASRFDLVTEASFENRELTKFFVVPPGSDTPTP